MTDTLAPPSELGSIATLDDGWEIRFERRLRHSPERVWKALTTPGGLACWLAEADIDMVPGGKMDLHFRQPDHEFMPDTPDRRIQNNEVLVVEPYTRFEHTFGSNELSVVSWRLTPDGDGTHIQLIHRIPQGWAGGRANVMTGWRTHLEGLEDAIRGCATAGTGICSSPGAKPGWRSWSARRDPGSRREALPASARAGLRRLP